MNKQTCASAKRLAIEEATMGHALDSKKKGQPNQKEQENSDNDNNLGQTKRKKASRHNSI